MFLSIQKGATCLPKTGPVELTCLNLDNRKQGHVFAENGASRRSRGCGQCGQPKRPPAHTAHSPSVCGLCSFALHPFPEPIGLANELQDVCVVSKPVE